LPVRLVRYEYQCVGSELVADGLSREEATTAVPAFILHNPGPVAGLAQEQSCPDLLSLLCALIHSFVLFITSIR
jgi:hypothetical protein